jgi:phage terminase large subunit-like protein
MTRAEKVIAFIHKYCLVPEGEHMGKPVRLAPFQEKFIRDIYDNPHGTDTAILSIARKNGKTGIIACIVLAHLVGTEARQNSRIISGAMSREQAGEVFNLASKMVQLSPQLSEIIRIIPSAKKLVGIPMNVEYQATSAEAKTAHGKSPVLAILDEVGQVTGARSDFIDAISTAQGAHKDPLLIYISTQAANDGDLLSILIDDALTNKPPKTVCHVYAASETAQLDDEEEWKKANPALGIFRSMDDMRKQAENASRMPSFENTFRNLNLNQRISSSSPFVSRNIWNACNAPPMPIEECSEVYGGLDLSARTDLTAFVLFGYHDESMTWNVYPYFFTPSKTLHERAKRDRAPYDVWVDKGHMMATPGMTVDYEFVAAQIVEICGNVKNLVAVAYDRWRIDVLKKELERLGVELPLTEWGQGFKDMSPALDALESKLLNAEIRHGGHPVLTMCASNSTVYKGGGDTRKLDKMKNSGRIDGMVALTMAAGLAQRKHETPVDISEFLNNPLVV